MNPKRNVLIQPSNEFDRRQERSGSSLTFWLFLLGLLFAAWALYEHVVTPALRWMLTAPANRVLEDVSSRLRIGIRPFQRTRRQALIKSG